MTQNNELKEAMNLCRVKCNCRIRWLLFTVDKEAHGKAGGWYHWYLFCLHVQYVLHGSDLRSVHRNIPRSVLPQEYGGTAGQLDMGAWSSLLLDCEEEFIVEFCQPDPLEGVVLPDSMLFEGEQASGQDDDTFRGLRSQLYYCY